MSSQKAVRTARWAVVRTSLLCIALAAWPGRPGGLIAQAAPPGGAFRAGAATSNITPALGSSINGNMQDARVQRIHDELHARAVVLDDGATKLAIVVVDNTMLPRDVIDEGKRLAHLRTGIPVENMLVSATHTHSAGTATAVFQSFPEEGYRKLLSTRIADAIGRGAANLEPARIGWGSGTVAGQIFNRRWRMRAGTIPPNPFGGIDGVRMNPPAGSPDLLEAAGPTDPELSILSVQATDGRPLAMLANLGLHYVGGVPNGDISADYFGAFADRVERALGVDPRGRALVAIMSNGASGDVNNTDHSRPRVQTQPYAKIDSVAEQVASEAVRVYRTIEHRAWVPLDAARTELSVGVRRPGPDELQRAKRLVSSAAGPAMQSREEIYARETLFLADYPDTVPLVLQALRIGELAITAIPAEVFTEIGLELKRRSPFPESFTISLANGYNGYLPTPEQHALGGYETWRARSSYLAADASVHIVGELLTLLDQLEPTRPTTPAAALTRSVRAGKGPR